MVARSPWATRSELPERGSWLRSSTPSNNGVVDGESQPCVSGAATVWLWPSKFRFRAEPWGRPRCLKGETQGMFAKFFGRAGQSAKAEKSAERVPNRPVEPEP